jgi:hypothetical protein
LELLLSKKQEEVEDSKAEIRRWKAILAETEDKSAFQVQELLHEKKILIEMLLKERLTNKDLHRQILDMETMSLYNSRLDSHRHCHEEILLKKEIDRLQVESIANGSLPSVPVSCEKSPELEKGVPEVPKSLSEVTIVSPVEEDHISQSELKALQYENERLKSDLEEAHQIIDIQHEKLISNTSPGTVLNETIQKEFSVLKTKNVDIGFGDQLVKLEELLVQQSGVILKQDKQIQSLCDINKEVKGLLVAMCIHKDHPSNLAIKYNDALLEIQKLKSR